MYGFVFERHQRTIFSLRSCTACARVLSLCMLARSRGAARDGSCSRTRRQRRKVDKCRVADKKQTDKPTNKHTLLFYRYRYLRYSYTITVPIFEYSSLNTNFPSRSVCVGGHAIVLFMLFMPSHNHPLLTNTVQHHGRIQQQLPTILHCSAHMTRPMKCASYRTYQTYQRILS